jgi:hypothetical protein
MPIGRARAGAARHLNFLWILRAVVQSSRSTGVPAGDYKPRCRLIVVIIATSDRMWVCPELS